ncbi:MAG: hypothetical protein CM1200mP38_8100 [Dehalococcoidia bacterium]|nr:MAG: hypothetical protein CM1200mP38_8100 [Dehalococcoidia bacterium]
MPKKLLTGRLLLDSENTNSVAYKIGQDYLFFDKSDTLQETISKINNVQLMIYCNFAMMFLKILTSVWLL